MNWTIEKFTGLATGYWRSCVLLTGVELGVFDALANGSASAEEVAGKIGASARHTAALLDALAGLAIVEKTAAGQDSVYRIRPSAARFLTRTGPHCILDALRLNNDMYPLWGDLARCIREGKPPLTPGLHLGADPARTRRFVLAMHSRAVPLAAALMSAVDVRDRSHLLDLGAGPGTFSALLAEKYSSLRITLFDLPPILVVSKDLIAHSKAAARISFHPGDYRKDPLPAGFDSVLYSGAFHQEDPESAARVARKIFDALLPGGKLFVVDMMVQRDKTQPVFSALFSLNMMLTSPIARVFSDEEVIGILSDAGFVNVRCNHLPDSPYWVVAAEKQGDKHGR